MATSKITYKVNYVADGDTISVISSNGTVFNSRARWIDCPETKKVWQTSTEESILNHWEWGEKATKFVKGLLTHGVQITLYNYGLDQYGRTLSDWYVGGTALKSNIQYQLISQGLAVPFLPFDRYDWPIARELTLLKGIIDGTAKSNKSGLGFWSDYKLGKFLLPSEVKKLTI